MSESEEFGKGIERIIDHMITRLPEDMQSGIRKQLAHQRELAWIARAEAIKAQGEQRRLEEAAKKAADSAEQELLKLLLNVISQENQQLRQTDPGKVQKDVDLLLKINEKYTDFEVAKVKCRKEAAADAIYRLPYWPFKHTISEQNLERGNRPRRGPSHAFDDAHD